MIFFEEKIVIEQGKFLVLRVKLFEWENVRLFIKKKKIDKFLDNELK